MLALYTPPARPAFSVCGFHWLTGRPCPLCGMTRAFFALAKGHFVDAFHFNALSLLAFAVAVAVVAGKQPRWLPILAVFGIYGILRALALVP